MHSEPESSSLLLAAVERGDAAHVRLLLDQGADPNAYLDRTERLPTVESVAAHGLEDVTRRETALDLAARCGRGAVVGLLLERGAQVTAAALGHAVHAMDQELIRCLLGAGADPNALVWTTDKVPDADDPLRGGELVTVHVRAPVVEVASGLPDPAPFVLLVAAGGRAGKVELSRALRRAFGSGNVAAVGPVVETAERLGVTVDPITVIGQEPAVVRFVLERRWRLQPESATPERRRAELTPLLMRAAFLYSAATRKRELPLLKATAEYLIAQGADPDFFEPRFRIREIPHQGRDPGPSPISPLHEALRALRDPANSAMVRLLLEHGARTTFVFEDGRRETALDVAKRALAPQFHPWIAGILRPFEEARAKDAVASDILRPFEEAPFRLSEGLFLERSGVLLPWDAERQGLRSMGSPLSRGPYLLWQGERFLGGLAGNVSMHMEVPGALVFFLQCVPPGPARDVYPDMRAALEERFGPPHSAEVDEQLWAPESYPWVRWRWGDVWLSLRIQERFGEGLVVCVGTQRAG